jgi:hypothetical protein
MRGLYCTNCMDEPMPDAAMNGIERIVQIRTIRILLHPDGSVRTYVVERGSRTGDDDCDRDRDRYDCLLFGSVGSRIRWLNVGA